MRSFRDKLGREWQLEVNPATVKKVRAATRFNIYDLGNDGFKTLADILADPVTFTDVLFCLVRDSKGNPPESEESFGEGFAGDVLRMASIAFQQELVEHFPNARTRAGLKRALEGANRLEDLLVAQFEAEIDALDPDAELVKLVALRVP